MNAIVKGLSNAVRVTHPAAGNVRSLRRVRLTARMLLGRERPITQADLSRYTAAMHQGDPLADALAGWMAEAGFAHGMQLFERALEQGIDAVPDAPDCLRAFFEEIEAMPDWLDMDRVRLGQRAINRAGIAVPFLLGEIFLLGGYGVSAAMNQALVMTGGLRDGSTRKRTLETSAWWLEVTKEGGLARDAAGFKTTARVRLLHAVVRRKLNTDPAWDRATHGLPINQAHMAATGQAFAAGCLLACRMFGVRFTRPERAAFMHLWRYANHLIGVDPAFNTELEKEGMRIIFLAALTAPEENPLAQELAHSYTEQVQYQFPKLGLPGRVLSHCIGRGRLGLAWLGLGRPAYRRLGLREAQAWLPLTLGSLAVLNARETVRKLLPATEDWFTRTGRRLQELQVDLLRETGDQPDAFIPYDERDGGATAA